MEKKKKMIITIWGNKIELNFVRTVYQPNVKQITSH